MNKIYRNKVKLKDVELFYYDTKEDKPVIICVHGMYGRAETWSDFMEHYSKDYRIIAPDLRGHGFSSKPDSYYTFEEMGNDILQLITALKIPKVILFGHSMGGGICGYLAANFPDIIRGVAILDKSAKGPTKKEPILASQAKQADALTKDWADYFDTKKRALQCIESSVDSKLGVAYFLDSLHENENGYYFLFDKKALAGYRANTYGWMELLPKITCLTLLLVAKGGEAVPYDDFIEMKKALPNVMAYTMHETDHNVHLSNKKEFYTICDTFLKQL